MSSFAPATRTKTHARIALAGPPGSGKTYTALALAHELGENIVVVDTERRSASEYAGHEGWAFRTVAPSAFSPESLTSFIAEAGDEGVDVLVVDSMSHYWFGPDGMLEQADRLKRGNNVNSGWKEIRPAERQMLEALTTFPGHVIVTLRVRTEHVVDHDERGRPMKRRVGLKAEQSEGIEYEFDVVGDLDSDNVLTVVKTRVPTIAGGVYPQPGKDLAGTLADWLTTGERIPTSVELRDQAFAATTSAEVYDIGLQLTRAGYEKAPVRNRDGVIGELYEVVLNRYNELIGSEQRAAREQAKNDG